MPTLSIPAPAKLNLGLQVLDRRPDGYHELVTILQALELADTVHISDASQIEGEPSLPGLARAQDLTFKAAERLHARLRPQTGAYLRVDKHVPSGAGLGGGSSDAAATLLGLDAFWQTGADGSLLAEIARSLGADVPFFLRGGTMLATGRGDLLEPLAAPPRRWVLLVKPDAEIAAADAYATLQSTEWSDGADTLALGGAIQLGELPGRIDPQRPHAVGDAAGAGGGQDPGAIDGGRAQHRPSWWAAVRPAVACLDRSKTPLTRTCGSVRRTCGRR